MQVELHRGLVRYYLVLAGKNGEDLMVSEHYYSKANAKRAASKLGKALKIKAVGF